MVRELFVFSYIVLQVLMCDLAWKNEEILKNMLFSCISIYKFKKVMFVCACVRG